MSTTVTLPQIDGPRGSCTMDDIERAEQKACKLLREILPDDSWRELEDQNIIHITGKRGVYLISRHDQTEVRDIVSNRYIAHTCLRLSIPAPKHDRMIAEYLLIKNAEDLYWKTANVFDHSINEFTAITIFLMTILNVALVLNLLRVAAGW